MNIGRISLVVALLILCLPALALAEPQSYPGHRGYGSSKPCPWSCKMAGLPSDKCREWRTGNTCYIEDFTRAPRSGSNPPPAPQVQNKVDSDGILGKGEIPNPLIDYNHKRPPAVAPVDPGSSAHQGGDRPGYQECRNLSPYDIGKPYIDVGQSKATGNLFGDKYKIRGSVEGTCLVEAGLFQHGRKVYDIPITTSRDFHRFEFELKASVSDEPEIRVYNITGDRDIYRFTGER